MDTQKAIKLLMEISARSSENQLHKETREMAWDTPLIGLSSGDDPIFQDIKRKIGNFHWLPEETFQLAFPSWNGNGQGDSQDLTVISLVYPQTEKTKELQRQEKRIPAENWVRSRYYWEPFAEDVATTFIEALSKLGIKCTCPILLPHWAEKNNFTSNWSEPHIAYACGLGTFGLSGWLITPAGKAVRYLSLIAECRFEPTKRPYSTYNEYCLFYTKGTCKKCAERCPASAIDDNGHNKSLCGEYGDSLYDKVMELYHIPNKSCGLCQAGVPCESSIPG